MPPGDYNPRLSRYFEGVNNGQELRSLWEGTRVRKPGQPRSQRLQPPLVAESAESPRHGGLGGEADAGLHPLHPFGIDPEGRALIPRPTSIPISPVQRGFSFLGVPP